MGSGYNTAAVPFPGIRPPRPASDAAGSHPLPPPAVPAEVYTEEYYRTTCAGAEPWETSGGCRFDPLYAGSLRVARLAPGEVLVDIGTGRGELLAEAVAMGAARAVGVEYSPAAVALAERTLAVRAVTARAEVLLADARAIPLDDGMADLVTMLDVVEHLERDELRRTIDEVRRLLRPGGRLVVHTLPNRTIYNVTYRLQRLARPGRWRSWPLDPRNESERLMHVNEQSLGSLRRALVQGGFARPRVWVGEWMHTSMVPDERARRLYERLAARRLTRRFGGADLWAEAVKAPAGARRTRGAGGSGPPG